MRDELQSEYTRLRLLCEAFLKLNSVDAEISLRLEVMDSIICRVGTEAAGVESLYGTRQVIESDMSTLRNGLTAAISKSITTIKTLAPMPDVAP